MAQDVKVWDPLVRIGHWTIVAGFAIAYFTEDDLLAAHVWAGYVVGAAVLVRIIWGFVGPAHARFADFVHAPRAVAAYLVELVRFRATRYLGHSPAGGAMVVALLLMLAGTVASGVMVLGAEKHAGPLASLYAASSSSAERAGGGAANGEEEESALKEVHELLANLTLVLVGLHVAGVLLASAVHRENLVGAMITGRKRLEREERTPRGKSAVGR